MKNIKTIFFPIFISFTIMISSLYSQTNFNYSGWEGHYGPVSCITFDKLGSTLISGGNDGTIRMWDLNNNSLFNTFLSTNNNIVSLSVSADNKKIVSLGYTVDDSIGKIEIWDFNSTSLSKRFSTSLFKPKKMILSKDGKKVAVCWNEIQIYDLNNGELIKSFPQRFSESIAFSSDGSKIISGNSKGNVEFIDIASGTVVKTFSAHTSNITAIAISPDGLKIATGSHDEKLKIWDMNGSLLNAFIVGHYNDITSIEFSSNGSRLVSGSLDKTVRIWQLNPGNLLHTFLNHTSAVNSVSFSPDGTKIASASDDATIKLWDVSNTEYPMLSSFYGHNCFLYSLAYSKDGNSLFTAGDDNKIKMWDTDFGMILKTFSGHSSTVYNITTSPDGTKLASASGDLTVRLWGISNGIKIFSGHKASVQSVSFSKDGTKLASIDVNGLILLWDVKNLTLLDSLVTNQKNIFCITFSPDGSLLITARIKEIADSNGGITLWNIKDHIPIEKINKSVSSFAFSPDGTYILFNDLLTDTLFLWNVKNGITKNAFYTPDRMVNFVSFSPNGKFFAAAHSNGKINIWNIDHSNPIKTINFDHGYSKAITFSPDGKKIASVGWGYNNIRIFDVSDFLSTENLESPKSFSLYQNYPNPFNPSTNIRFQILNNEFVSLKIYDILGNEVKTIVNQNLHPGIYNYIFDTKNIMGLLTSGVYFYQLKTGSFMETKKMLLIK